MHMQGDPRTMQQAPHYVDVVKEVKAFLIQRAHACEEAGYARQRIVIEAKDGGGWWNRTFSWFGQGGTEAATQHQGIQVDAKGGMSIGANKGTGVLERFWAWLRGAFWTVLIVGAVLLVVPAILVAIPATSGIGSVMLRVVASIFGPLGSLVEWIRGKIVYQKPLTTLQAAVDAFPTLIQALPGRQPTDAGEGFTPAQKQAVLTIHSETHTA
jgi:hypothetical protein